MSATEEPLPRWDLSNIYRGLDQEDYRDAFARYEKLLAELEKIFDERGIRRTSEPPADERFIATLADALNRANELAMLGETLGAFVYGVLTTNSYDADAIRETSKLEILGTRRQQLEVRLKGWVGSLGDRLEALDRAQPTLANARVSVAAVGRSRAAF